MKYNAITPTIIVPIPEEKLKYLKVTYLVDDSLQCQIVSNPNNILAIKIDGGEEIPWVIPDSTIQTFKTPGEHTIEFILLENVILNGMFNASYVGTITNIEFPEVEMTVMNGALTNVSVKSLIIPNTIESIGIFSSPNLETLEVNCKVLNSGSFSGSTSFSSLKTIKIGKDCTILGGCFSGLNSLDEVYIEGTFASGAGSIFSGTNIKKLIIGGNFTNSSSTYGNFGGSNIDIAIINDVSEVFDLRLFGLGAYPKKIEFHCKKVTNSYGGGSYSGSLEEVIFGNEVEEIVVTDNQWFLLSCNLLSKISIGNSLKRLAYFINTAPKLTSLTIPSTVKEIGQSAFYNLGSSQYLNLKFEGPIKLENYAITGGTRILTLDIPVGSKLFSGTQSSGYIETIIFNDGGNCLEASFRSVFGAEVNNVLFRGSSINLKQEGSGVYAKVLTIDSSVNYISDYAFYNWDYLTTVDIPKSVNYIGKHAFSETPGVSIYNIKADEIGESAFEWPRGDAKTYYIDSKIIGKRAFFYNSNAKFYFSKRLVEIKEEAFLGNYFNLSLDIFNCKIIGARAFLNNTSGSFYITLENVEEIGEEAFSTIYNSNAIYHLNNIKSIGKAAFKYNYLRELTLGDNLKEIGESAFENAYLLSGTLAIPDSLKIIPDKCFYNCKLLDSLILGSGVNNLSNTAFNSCEALSNISVKENNKVYDSRENCNAVIETKTNTLVLGGIKTFVPSTVEKIGDNAFKGMVVNNAATPLLKLYPKVPPILGLDALNIKSTNPLVIYVPTDSIELYRDAWGDYVQPENVKEFNTIKVIINSLSNSSLLFPSNGFVTKVTLDNLEEIKSIGETLNISQGVHTLLYEFNIGNIGTTLYELFGPGVINRQLKELEVSSSCSDTSITGLKIYLKDLTSIKVSENNSTLDSRNNCNAIIDTNLNILMVGCSSTIIPETVTSIGQSAFRNVEQLTSITLGNNITKLEAYAFYGCVNLETITMSDALIDFGQDVFLGCTSLPYFGYVLYADTFAIKIQPIPSGEIGYYSIKEGTKYLGHNLFLNCSFSHGITLPEGLRIIGNNAFRNSNISHITIPSSVIKIGTYAFASCTSLTNAILSEGITSTETYMFYYCTNLTSVTLPNTLTTIANSTFATCNKLPSITIPSGVTTIDSSAFSGCTLLKEITIDSNSLTSKTSYTGISNNFYKLFGSLVTKYIFTDNIQTIGKYECYSCVNLEIVEIGANITSIGAYAFNSCNKLKNITIKATTPPTLALYALLNVTGRTIYVPAESVDTYKAASGWSKYASLIQAIDE